MSSPAFLGDHPRPADERRLMAHMLPVPASEVGYPVTVLILMKADDTLLHLPEP